MSNKSKKIVFSDAEKELLIECYQSRPILWDFSSDDNKKNNQKRLAIGDIIREMSEAFNKQYNAEDIKTSWKNLRTQYSECKKKAKGETGKATEETAKKWKFFDKMTFLETANVPVERKCSLNVKKEMVGNHSGNNLDAQNNNLDAQNNNLDAQNNNLDADIDVETPNENDEPPRTPNIGQQLTPAAAKRRASSGGGQGSSTTKRRALSGRDNFDEIKSLIDSAQIDPIAQMVHNTATKVQAISNRRYIEFRREITYVLDKYELDIEEGGKDEE